MRRILAFFAFSILASMSTAAVAGSPALGVGVAYFDRSAKSAPVISGAYDFTRHRGATVAWMRDGSLNHATAGLELALAPAPFELGTLYLSAGGGYAWRAWRERTAELAMGGGVAGSLGQFEARLGYVYFTSGPEAESSSAVYAAAYVGGKPHAKGTR